MHPHEESIFVMLVQRCRRLLAHIECPMTAERIAIVTPSFERDFELCRTLNRSVMEFLPAAICHYIIVDRRDISRFRPLSGDRTIVLTKEEILPRGFVQLPKTNRWLAPGTIFPVAGWLVQQIAKIAAASVLSESTLVMVDSDAVFVRDVDPGIFARNGETRLYVQRGGIIAGMEAHIAWTRNACDLLGLSIEPIPTTDYIGQVISWKRDLVLQMCDRVESTTGRRWYGAVARARQFSEYLLYGLFVERVAGVIGNAWVDENPRCNSRWEVTPLPLSGVEAFIGALCDDDLALMINTHSGTAPEARAAAIALASNGRL
jgi:hypothetical protein